MFSLVTLPNSEEKYIVCGISEMKVLAAWEKFQMLPTDIVKSPADFFKLLDINYVRAKAETNIMYPDAIFTFEVTAYSTVVALQRFESASIEVRTYRAGSTSMYETLGYIDEDNWETIKPRILECRNKNTLKSLMKSVGYGLPPSLEDREMEATMRKLKEAESRKAKGFYEDEDEDYI